MKKYPDENEWQDGFEKGDSTDLVPFAEAVYTDKKSKRRLPIAWLIVCLCVVATAALLTVALKNSTPKALQNLQAEPSDSSASQDEWKGAFSARNIYEECYESAVTVRVGRDNGDVYWSGFVIDSDGWIVTSLDLMNTSGRGKVYVSFNDGREYSVESVLRDKDNGVALMKISAEGLNAVELREGELHEGERLICVSALEYGRSCVLSGELCGTLDGSFKVNIGLDAHGTGAPVFDEEGCIVGMATARDIEKDGRISYAVNAKICEDILEKVK